MKVNWFKIIIYFSILFLIIYLIKSDNLKIPKVIDYKSLILSVSLLFIAFTALCARWFFTLKHIKLPIKFNDAIISCGLSIFAKYVPGKILMILGKTSHIKQKYGYANSSLITASFNDQLLAIWSGLLIGSLSLISFNNNSLFLSILVGNLVFGFLIFNNFLFKLLKIIIKKTLKKELDINILKFKVVIKLLPLHLCYWLLIGFGFYFLFRSLYNIEISISGVFAFPLSIVGGIISIISPGGIGIRESILAYYFSFQIDNQIAISVSSISRLWFLLGEVFIFLIALSVSIITKSKNNRLSSKL